MEIVIDSHALFWYLSSNPKLSPRALQQIEDSTTVVVPSIVVLEVLFLLRKSRTPLLFIDFLRELKSRNYTIYPLDLDVISQVATLSRELEIHDSIIVATAQLRGAPLITKDEVIKKLYQPMVIW